MPFPPSHPALDRALAARGYAEPTPVQLAVLEADTLKMDGTRSDLLVSAQTGSGKTVAFGLALASSLLDDRERFDAAGRPLALIIAPTRELAMQISRELDWLYAQTGARIVTCVGGMSVRMEQNQLSGGAHIVIGTPGRLCDHLTKGYLDLSSLQVAVLDEADEMLDLGFREELETLLDATPTSRRTLLFSATIARGIAMLAKNYQRDAVRVDTTSQTEPHGDIDYRAMRISPGDTERSVVNVLRYFEAGGALVFCATREAVRHLHASLRERGFHAVGLSGEMNQRERNDALQALRDGHARVCVATDVAARGLDLPDLGLVIHADLPTNKATLLHRSGRTGRAGRKGTSVLLVTHTKRRRTEEVLRSANITATWSGPPTAEEIRAQDRLRLLDHPALGAVISEDDQALARQIVERLPAEQIAGALIGLLRADLPDPEDVSDDARMRDTAAVPARGRDRERGEREPMPRLRADRGFSEHPGDGAWFRLNVGRRRNADPKWLVPLICRLGHITKAEIGPIRIFEDETKFEIVPHAAPAFAIAVEATLNDNMQITPSGPPQRSDAPSPREHKPPRDSRPPRGDARKPQEERRTEAAAAIEADPVMASLKAERVANAASPAPPSEAALNRRARRDAARAAGALPEIKTSGDEAPKRTWSPVVEAAPVQPGAETQRSAPGERSRYERRDTRPAVAKSGESKSRESGSRESRPRDSKPRDGKPFSGKTHGAKPFTPRGDQPGRGKPAFGKPEFGKPHRSKPQDGKPAGATSFGSKPAAGRPAGGKPKRDWRA